MKLRHFTSISLGLACLCFMTSCQTATQGTPRMSRAELEQQLADSRELVRRYEKRYGKLLPERPTHDFRKLREQLKGKPASTVVALLGKPAKVYSLGSSGESWDYMNVAYDPVSGRTVRVLEIWFDKGVVHDVTASY
jgi:hypothetical protein